MLISPGFSARSQPRSGTIKRWTSRNKHGTSCSLPPELVLAILESAWEEDLGFAATASLLCKSVLERTRRFLYTCPTLRSVGQINLFLRTIKKNPGLAKRVKSAVLNGENAGSNKQGMGQRMRGAVTTRLPQLLELCTNLQELTLKDAIVFSLTDFSNSDCKLFLRRCLDIVTHLLAFRSSVTPYSRRYSPLGSNDNAEVSEILYSSQESLDSHSPRRRIRFVDCRSLLMSSYSPGRLCSRTRRMSSRRSTFDAYRSRSLRTSSISSKPRIARAQGRQEYFPYTRRPLDHLRDPSKVHKSFSSRNRSSLRL